MIPKWKKQKKMQMITDNEDRSIYMFQNNYPWEKSSTHTDTYAHTHRGIDVGNAIEAVEY